jgi:hypothetical protein
MASVQEWVKLRACDIAQPGASEREFVSGAARAGVVEAFGC